MTGPTAWRLVLKGPTKALLTVEATRRLTIFLLAALQLEFESVRLRGGWQHDAPPHYQQGGVARVAEDLHGRRVVHVLQGHSVGADDAVVDSASRSSTVM